MRITLLLLLLVTSSAVAQKQSIEGKLKDGKLLGILPVENNKVAYSGVITIEGVDKNALFQRAKRWFVNDYRSAKDVIQMDDAQGGVLVGKGIIPVNWKTSVMSVKEVSLYHTLTIQCKDGKYRYEITDFNGEFWIGGNQYASLSLDHRTLEQWALENAGKNTIQFYQTVDNQISQTINSLQKFMMTPLKDF